MDTDSITGKLTIISLDQTAQTGATTDNLTATNKQLSRNQEVEEEGPIAEVHFEETTEEIAEEVSTTTTEEEEEAETTIERQEPATGVAK